MADVIPLIPRATYDAQANVRHFIKLRRSNPNPFGRDIDFESNVWDITGYAGIARRHTSYLCFTRLGIRLHGPRRKPPIAGTETLLRKPFRSFAKALISYLYGLRPSTGSHVRFEALRYLEAALYDLTGSVCPTATTPQVLDRACTLMMNTTSCATAYNCSSQLQVIYSTMVQLGLVAVPCTWRSPIRCPQGRRQRVGKVFDAERFAKLPSPLALTALAEIFTSSTDVPIEIAGSSICALLLCAPDRITEALHIPLDCITPDWKDPDTGEWGTGLRWFPLKNAPPMIKTIIPSMSDIAKRAVQQLRHLSEPARVVARWYDANRDSVYLPAHLEYLRGKEQLSMTELGLVLFDGKCNRNAGHLWAKRNNLPLVGGKRGHPCYVRFQAVEKAVLALLPRGFPIMDPRTGMRFVDALCISRPNEFRAASATLQCQVEAISYGTIKNALKGGQRQKSIFDERGFTDSDGRPLFISTHMLRHYLNTLARQSGRLTEEDIAKWSGRKDIGQNKTYNQVSDKDMLAHIRRAVGDPTRALGPLANIDKRIFISRDEFAKLKIVTAHTSELGYCVHDFTMSPCQVHGDCINCNEQLCIKGDSRAETNLRRMGEETAMLLGIAKAARDEKDYGADKWVKHHTVTLERINQLITILDNPAVPLGSVIQLSGVAPASRVAQTTEQRMSLQGFGSIGQTIQSVEDVHTLLSNGRA